MRERPPIPVRTGSGIDLPTHGGMARLSRPVWLWLNTIMREQSPIPVRTGSRVDQRVTNKPSSHHITEAYET